MSCFLFKEITTIFLAGLAGRSRKGMNLNKLAEETTKAEGGKVSLNVAQVKEVIGIVMRIFGKAFDAGDDWPRKDCLRLYKRPRKAGKSK